jgi:hypothetical protein
MKLPRQHVQPLRIFRTPRVFVDATTDMEGWGGEGVREGGKVRTVQQQGG